MCPIALRSMNKTMSHRPLLMNPRCFPFTWKNASKGDNATTITSAMLIKAISTLCNAYCSSKPDDACPSSSMGMDDARGCGLVPSPCSLLRLPRREAAVPERDPPRLRHALRSRRGSPPRAWGLEASISSMGAAARYRGGDRAEPHT